MELLRMEQACKVLNVSKDTIRRHEREGKINANRTLGGHRRYNKEEIERIAGFNEKEKTRNAIIYCRVSTKKQEESGNLTRQKERLVKYAINNDLKIVEVFEEIGSGINEKRKKLMKLLNKTKEEDVDYVIIEYKDRLARFGLVYLKKLIENNNCKLVIIEELKDKSLNEEMVEDMVSIITSFSARIYGKRGGRKIKQELGKLQNETTTNN